MRIKCVCCGKQALNEEVGRDEKYITTLIGAKAAMHVGECYCGHCATELDENGLFPEERALCSTI
jgi:hypothetical protein